MENQINNIKGHVSRSIINDMDTMRMATKYTQYEMLEYYKTTSSLLQSLQSGYNTLEDIFEIRNIFTQLKEELINGDLKKIAKKLPNNIQPPSFGNTFNPK